MGGLISKGDLTGAAKAGLLRAHTLISAPVRPSTPAPVTIVNHNEKPADLSGFFSFLKWLLLLAVLGGVVWLFLLWRSGKAKCHAAQQKAQNAKSNCTNLIDGFITQLTTLNALMGPLKTNISAIEFETFQSKLNGIKARMDSAKGQFANRSGLANDPECTGLSSESYAVMTNTFERLYSNLEQVSNDANKLERSLREMGRTRDSAQPAINELTREIELATTTINGETTLKTDGPRATLKRAIDLLELAEEHLMEKRFQAVISACQEGMTLAKKSIQELKGLSSRKRSVQNAISLLDAVDISGILPKVDATILATRQAYGNGAVSDAANIRAAIVAKLSERRSALAAAKSAFTTQNWVDAERQIEVVKKVDADINYKVGRIEDLGPAIIRGQQAAQQAALRAQQEAARRASYSSKSSGHSHSHHTHEDRDLGFGTGMVVGGLTGLAVGASLEREERRSRNRNDDDNGLVFGGESVQSSSSNDEDRGFGGESVQSTSSNDDSGFSSNND
jgi:hypothetical protein